MSQIDTTTADLCLKHFYLPVLVRNVYASKALFNRIEKTNRYCYGDYAIIGRKIHQNMGMGPIPTETGDFPTPGDMTFRQPTVYMKLQGGTMRISWVAMMVSKDKRGAFVPLLTEGMEDAEDSFQWEIARQWWGDGKGALGYLMSTAVAADNLPVDDGQELTGSGTAGNYHHFLRPGMVVNICDTSDDFHDGYISGTSAAFTIQEDTRGNYVTLDRAIASAPADGYYFVKTNSNNAVNGGTTDAWYDMMGMLGIVSDEDPITGNFQGYARSGAPWNCSIVHENPDAAGTLRDIDVTVIEDMLSALEYHNSNVTAGYLNYPVKNQMIADAIRDRRFTGGSRMVDGYTAYEYDGLPLFLDRHAPRNCIMLGDESVIKVHHVAPPGFFEVNGQILCWVPGTAARKPMFEANLIYYANLGCDDPSKWGIIKDLREPSTRAVAPNVA